MKEIEERRIQIRLRLSRYGGRITKMIHRFGDVYEEILVMKRGDWYADRLDLSSRSSGSLTIACPKCHLLDAAHLLFEEEAASGLHTELTELEKRHRDLSLQVRRQSSELSRLRAREKARKLRLRAPKRFPFLDRRELPAGRGRCLG